MKNELNKVILTKLSSTQIINNSVFPWSNSDRRILNHSLEKNTLVLKDIEKVLHEVLLQTGRKCFMQHLKAGTSPDHVISPQSLVYALDHNEFTTKEEKQIQFDGETKEEFIKCYGKDILGETVHFVLTEQKNSVSSVSDESDCDGCCNH